MTTTMKQLLIFFFLLATIPTFSQTVSYKLVEDNPDKLSESFINLEILGIDYGANATDGLVYAGLNSFWSVSERLKAEALVRGAIFNIKGEGLGLQTEAGLFLPLIIQRKKKEVPVKLSTKLFAGETADGRSYDAVKTMNVLGTYKNQIGPRGGLYVKKAGYFYEDQAFDVTNTSMTLIGSYIGLERMTQAFVHTKVEGKDKYGAGQTRMYADVLLIPVREVAASTITDIERDKPIGWRVGLQWNAHPHKTKSGFEPRVVYGGEIGSRPLSGFYANVSIGMMLWSK